MGYGLWVNAMVRVRVRGWDLAKGLGLGLGRVS
jgi:hypothetical protein